MDSLETRRQWADWFAEALKGEHPEAAAWLKRCYGNSEMNAEIDEKIAAVGGGAVTD